MKGKLKDDLLIQCVQNGDIRGTIYFGCYRYGLVEMWLYSSNMNDITYSFKIKLLKRI